MNNSDMSYLTLIYVYICLYFNRYKQAGNVANSRSIYKHKSMPNMTCQGYSFANFVLFDACVYI